MDIRANFTAQRITKVFDGELSIIVQSIIDTKHEKEFDEAFRTYTLYLRNSEDSARVQGHIISWLAENGYWGTIKTIADKLYQLKIKENAK